MGKIPKYIILVKHHNWVSLIRCVGSSPTPIHQISGCGLVWLRLLPWTQEIAGSNPATPTKCGSSLRVRSYAVNVSIGVRFSAVTPFESIVLMAAR